jgi:hypothetical protein
MLKWEEGTHSVKLLCNLKAFLVPFMLFFQELVRPAFINTLTYEGGGGGTR